jgi:hypothetical protein
MLFAQAGKESAAEFCNFHQKMMGVNKKFRVILRKLKSVIVPYFLFLA